MEYPWASLGNFIVAVGMFLFAVGSALLAAAIKVVVALTRLTVESAERGRQIEELKDSFEERIGRMEQVVFPAMTAAINGGLHAMAGSSKGARRERPIEQ